MASEELFRDIPPFPQDVPVLQMYAVSLASLQAGQASAAQQLLAACQELGFFLLDLRGDVAGEAMIKEIDQLFHLGKDLFDLPLEEKEKYLHDIPRSFLGFKPRGQAKTETNEPDRFEWFNVGQDGLIGNTDLQALPPLVHGHIGLYKSFLKHGQSIIATINSTLATQLSLPSDTFTALQKPTERSGTVVRIIKAFATPEEEEVRTSMIHHTDFGSITLLANVVGGLQVLAPGKDPSDEKAWLWVKPQPGCLIVNLGDAMVQWTGGLLRSNCHRINHAPGLQRTVDRYSLAILARPNRDASMKRVSGGDCDDQQQQQQSQDDDLTAWEWEVKKAMSLKRGEAVVQSSGGKPAVHL